MTDVPRGAPLLATCGRTRALVAVGKPRKVVQFALCALIVLVRMPANSDQVLACMIRVLCGAPLLAPVWW